MAAAVADYRPAAPLDAKRAKGTEPWNVVLEPTTDVLTELGRRRRPGQVLVGFAADGGEAGLERARAKLAAKGADLFVFNDVSKNGIGFDSTENEVVIVRADGEHLVAKAPKRRIAAEVWDEVEKLLDRR